MTRYLAFPSLRGASMMWREAATRPRNILSCQVIFPDRQLLVWDDTVYESQTPPRGVAPVPVMGHVFALNEQHWTRVSDDVARVNNAAADRGSLERYYIIRIPQSNYPPEMGVHAIVRREQRR